MKKQIDNALNKPRPNSYQYRLSAFLVLGFILSTGLLSCIPLTDSNSGRPIFNTGDNITPEPTEPEIVTPVRPDDLFHIKPNYCLCRGGKPAMAFAGEHCNSICAEVSSENDNSTYLRGEVEVANLELSITHEHFQGDLNRFCTLPLDAENDNRPHCAGLFRELHSGNPEAVIDDTNLISIGDNNRFQILFTNQLREDKIYSFRLQSRSTYTHPVTRESSLLTGHTNTIQFKVKSPESSHNFGGPLKVGTTKRYFCIFTSGPSGDHLKNKFKQHFFFDAATDPPILPSSVTSVYCHEKLSPGEPDNPILRPRLGEEVAFKLWDKTDRRFYRNNDDQSKEIDINEFIKTRLQEKHNIITQGRLNFFSPLSIHSFPNVTTEGVPSHANDNNLNLAGFLLKAFVDPNGDGFPICPSEFDLRRPETDEKFDPQFDVLGEFVHATEALYIALRTPRQFDPISNHPVDDVLLINESLVKKIWFYRDNNNRLQFLDVGSENFKSLVSSKTIYFYWPADPVAPTVQKTGQEIYQIRSYREIRREIEGDDSSDDGSAPFPDRRIGCIPKS